MDLSDQQAFIWRQRLRQERAMRNITDTHVRIAEFTMGAIQDGADEMTHAEVAEATGYGVRTVGDAYRRLRGIGLLDWQAQYREAHGVRRRIRNRYWLRMPEKTPEPRPDLRRRPKHLLSSSYSSAQCAHPVPLLSGPPPGFNARFAAKLEAERRFRAWRTSGFHASYQGGG
jgi:hypothetical protein